MYMHVLHGFSAASHYSFLTTRLAFKLRGLLTAGWLAGWLADEVRIESESFKLL